MFVHRIDEMAMVEIGDNLGAMTSELRPSVFIEAGPKIYAYQIVESATGEQKTICKFRGMTLNYNALQLVNFEVIKDMPLGETERVQVTVHTEMTIKPQRKAGGCEVSIKIKPEYKL